MFCSVCEVENPKYKCPTCRTFYCSVPCCKEHKKVCVPIEQKNDVREEKTCNLETYNYPTEDTVPIEKLELLGNSQQLKDCIRNPHLREILNKLTKCEDPAEMMGKSMQEPIFTEFVDECLKIVSPEAK